MLGRPDTAMPHCTMSPDSGLPGSRPQNSRMKVWPCPRWVTSARHGPAPTTASEMNSIAGLLQSPPGGTTSPRKKETARG